MKLQLQSVKYLELSYARPLPTDDFARKDFGHFGVVSGSTFFGSIALPVAALTSLMVRGGSLDCCKVLTFWHY